ncbi:hypothetical protein KKD03_03345 [Patescibacteria group bacterium]|nr:hypothetical protein [Patescibacteria group bacterium]
MTEEGTFYESDGTKILAEDLAEKYRFHWDTVRAILINVGIGAVPTDLAAVVRTLRLYTTEVDLQDQGLDILNSIDTIAPTRKKS